MAINWFPGHMKKATDQIKQKWPLIDACVEITDARIPEASRNRELGTLLQGKPRIILLNKRDMAEPEETARWVAAHRKEGQIALSIDALHENPARPIKDAAQRLVQEKSDKRAAQSIVNREIRLLIFGIPNVGKSTLINRMIGRRSAAVGDRPGVTKTDQWLRTPEDLLLLDTPGILPTKLEETAALYLAWTGAIRDDILPMQDLGFELIRFLLVKNPEALLGRYHVEAGTKDPLQVMEAIGRYSGALLRGGEVDYTRTAKLILDAFRKLHFGRITLEGVA